MDSVILIDLLSDRPLFFKNVYLCSSMERVKVKYEAPEVIYGKIASLQEEINNAMTEFKQKYLS